MGGSRIVVAVCILLALLTLSFAQNLGLSFVDASAGAKVVVPVTVASGTAISAVEFDVSFDDSVLTPDSGRPAIKGDACTDHVVFASAQPDKVHVAIYSPTLANLSSGSLLAQLVFEVSASPQINSTPLTLTNIKACSAFGDVLTLGFPTNGKVTINGGRTAPFSGQNQLRFPHLANGAVGDGKFYTALLLTNTIDSPGRARVRFYKPTGVPFDLPVKGRGIGSDFTVDLQPNGATRLETDGSGPLSAGYAIVDATTPVAGTVMFGWLTGSGAVLTEAGVAPSPSHTEACLPVLYDKGISNTGVAFANTGSTAQSIILDLLGPSGELIASRVIPLDAGSQLARYVHDAELFPVLSSYDSLLGTLWIRANEGVQITALKQAVREGLITSFPVISPR